MSDPITMTIAGRAFPCRQHVPLWQIMKSTKAMNGKDQMARISAMYETIIALIAVDQKEEFDDYMLSLDMDPESLFKELNAAIGDVVQALGGRPKESSTASSSSPFSMPMQESSRVVSLQQGTVQSVPENSPTTLRYPEGFLD